LHASHKLFSSGAITAMTFSGVIAGIFGAASFSPVLQPVPKQAASISAVMVTQTKKGFFMSPPLIISMISLCIEKAYIFHASLLYAELQYGYFYITVFPVDGQLSREACPKYAPCIVVKTNNAFHAGYILSITVFFLFFRKGAMSQCVDSKSAGQSEEAKTGAGAAKCPAVCGSAGVCCIPAQHRADSAGSGACSLTLFRSFKVPVNTMEYGFLPKGRLVVQLTGNRLIRGGPLGQRVSRIF
jgi:hypothetical protein